jgi:uncharacterized protein YsxB (DUF464 family)
VFLKVTALTWCVLECYCPDVVCSGMSLLTWCRLEHHYSDIVCSGMSVL